MTRKKYKTKTQGGMTSLEKKKCYKIKPKFTFTKGRKEDIIPRMNGVRTATLIALSA